jgi:tetratricopeptide (TPR) repeat protein
MNIYKSVYLLLISILLLGCNNTKATFLKTQEAPLFNNLGSFHHPIKTKSSLAQKYFDQGLILFFGFDLAESIRSFQAATLSDPECAMCYWGLALSTGSKSNTIMNGKEKEDAQKAINLALNFVNKSNKGEYAYINALSKRYSNVLINKKDKKHTCHPQPNQASKEELKAYSYAMKELIRQFPNDPDAVALYAGSIFDLTEWNFWDKNYNPNQYTLEMISFIENAIKKHPKHAGLHHYYIHVIESSANPEKAIPSADILASLVPGGEHFVHMPSHIYMRVGRYHEASLFNHQLDNYLQGTEPVINYLHHHNIHFLWAAASMEGRRALALDTARYLVRNVSIEMLNAEKGIEGFLTIPYFAKIQFAEWKAILSEPKPIIKSNYVQAMWHYARTLSYLNLDKPKEASNEYKQFKAVINNIDFGKSKELLQTNEQLLIASNILEAKLASLNNNKEIMIKHLRQAVKIEDGLGYKEPPAWLPSTRQTLAAALIRIGQYNEAIRIFEEDLKNHPDNGWSLYGLAEGLKRLNRTNESLIIKEQFKKVWRYADIDKPIYLINF